jgi:hypothetical protein
MTERIASPAPSPEDAGVEALTAEQIADQTWRNPDLHEEEVRRQAAISANIDAVQSTWRTPSPEDEIRLTTRKAAEQPARHWGGQPVLGTRVNSEGYERREGEATQEAARVVEDDRLAEAGIGRRLRALRRRGH